MPRQLSRGLRNPQRLMPAIRRARLKKEKIGPRPLGKLFLIIGGRRRLVSIPLPTSSKLLATLIEKNPTTATLPRCKIIGLDA